MLVIAAPFILAALIDPVARLRVLRLVRGWCIASISSLARTLTRPRVRGVNGQVDANGQDPLTLGRIEERAQDPIEAPLHLMPPTAFVLPQPHQPNNEDPSPSAPVLNLIHVTFYSFLKNRLFFYINAIANLFFKKTIKSNNSFFQFSSTFNFFLTLPFLTLPYLTLPYPT